MISFIFYFLTIFLLFLFLIIITSYLISDIVAYFFGSPFVPTSNKIIDEILAAIPLKPNQVFYDLGSGDGRVVRMAVKKYQVKGVGVEINPLLYFWSKFLKRIQRLSNITFLRKNFFDINLSSAEVIFVFLLPKTLKKLKEKFQKECQKNTLIISHGFPIDGWEKYLVKKIYRSSFSTYFYRI